MICMIYKIPGIFCTLYSVFPTFSVSNSSRQALISSNDRTAESLSWVKKRQDSYQRLSKQTVRDYSTCNMIMGISCGICKFSMSPCSWRSILHSFSSRQYLQLFQQEEDKNSHSAKCIPVSTISKFLTITLGDGDISKPLLLDLLESQSSDPAVYIMCR